MEEHLVAGDEVTVLTCDAALKACDANPWNSLSHCLACMGLRSDLLKMLSAPIRKLPLVSSEYSQEVFADIPQFKTLDELRNFERYNVGIGSDIISSLITVTGSVYPCPIEHRRLIECYIRDFWAVYQTAVNYLDQFNFDRVYIFNGRFVPARAWIRACESRNITYVTQERLGSPDRVWKIENNGIHDPTPYPARIREFWEVYESDPKTRSEGKDFFEERPKGQLTGWYSFVTEQNAEQLPADWDASKQNIAIFASTESEFMGLPEYFLCEAFSSQSAVCSEIAQMILQKNSDIHFYLRIHPNSKEDVIRWWEDEMWEKLPNVTIIPPESPVSSYTLMWSCQKTVAWLTTMGVEATYWGKPSILLGRAFYGGIGAAYEPQSLAEAVDLIATRNLDPKPKENALAYGAFNRCGIPKLPFSEAITACKLTFKGQQPNAHPDILRSLWNWENIVSKAPAPAWAKRLWQYWEWRRLQNRVE